MPNLPLPAAPRLFARALLLRCPRCGGRGLRTSWFRFRDACPTCHLDLDRNESGYQVGSYFIGIVILFVTFGVILVGTIAATWPAPPWEVIQWSLITLMLVGPIVVLPFARTIYLALDLWLRPEG